MKGTDNIMGIIPLALSKIYNSKNRENDIFISYLELYNENLYDLINIDNNKLKINNNSIVNLSRVKCSTYNEAIDCLLYNKQIG